jgi:hypothetical protein
MLVYDHPHEIYGHDQEINDVPPRGYK